MTDPSAAPGFCRDCLAETQADERRCRACHSPRLVRHAEIHSLSIAHIDCDAFYAAVEKRDDPSLADKPLIVGGGTRGVVSTCCYIARIRGVRSAMPMFKAMKLAPDAVVIKPNMAKYSEVGHQVRELMLAVTPLVEPLSIDEAFLDLTGTARLHGRSPAKTLAVLIRDIEEKIGITASVGLAPNKYLAKVASDLEKPRGFSVIGKGEALTFLASKPVSLIWGVGKAMQESLAKDGITSIGQLQKMEKNDLMRRYGSMGARLYHLSRGEDMRSVSTDDSSKSIGAETTLDSDVSDYGELEALLWAMAQKVSRRSKEQGYGGYTVTLKLKTKDFKLRTRATTLEDPTQLAHRMFDAAKPLLRKEATGTEFRLIGIALSHLEEMSDGDEATLDPRLEANSKAEKAIDLIREKFGKEAVDRGLSLKVKD
ncbi:DNA polymerase IV [Aestuariivirga sp.]|uniref:DNA polymerase IV n=1 Tax=Aestuariivirga sp. TaxID=2650926 RepID=UPI0039E33522